LIRIVVDASGKNSSFIRSGIRKAEQYGAVSRRHYRRFQEFEPKLFDLSINAAICK
jgi:hypothetical protein